MGVGGTAGRLIKPPQRERGAQLEALCLLLLRDGNGSKERLLRRRRVHSIALEQNIAANAVRFSSEPALTTPLAIANDVGDGRKCLFRFTGLRLRLGQHRCEKWNVVAETLLSQSRETVAHFGKNGV